MVREEIEKGESKSEDMGMAEKEETEPPGGANRRAWFHGKQVRCLLPSISGDNLFGKLLE